MAKNYSKYSKTFLFRKAWGESVALLPDEDAGLIFKAIFTHIRGESAKDFLTDRPDLLPAAGAIIEEIEMNSKRYFISMGWLEQIEDNMKKEARGEETDLSFEII